VAGVPARGRGGLDKVPPNRSACWAAPPDQPGAGGGLCFVLLAPGGRGRARLRTLTPARWLEGRAGGFSLLPGVLSAPVSVWECRRLEAEDFCCCGCCGLIKSQASKRKRPSAVVPPHARVALSPQTGVWAVAWGQRGRSWGSSGPPAIAWGSPGSAVGCEGDVAGGGMRPSRPGNVAGTRGAGPPCPGR